MVLGCGALNVDYLFATELLVTDGETFCHPVTRQPGGSAANTIYGLSKLSFPCAFVGAVGDDPDGRLALEALAEVGVNTRAVKVREGRGTGKVFAFVDPKGRRALYVSPDANLTLTLDDMLEALTPEVRWVHCSSFAGDPPFEAQREFVSRLPEEVGFSFAPGALYARRGLKELEPMLYRCTLLFLTQAELETMTGEGVLLNGARLLLNLGVRVVVVTLGGEGSVVVTPGGCDYQTALAQRVVDTTGAGDGFAAGMLYGYLKGWPLELAHRLASIVAAFVVENWGARAGMPSLEEAKKRYEATFGLPFPE
ncbi:PfkB domain protein [Ammonifex degensii KC4]|uniref:PfkB domain protein n=1 Tax=Ammonifex degensii (strain DSM 10501 / KC4) TaxID=429009 RepID=C9RCR2_AMMDK|nr:carbohydrate kinase family protein [Ammonifex degensii]ACX52039.1 PfkB domain protein [Ammonifex degensii KC4]